MRNVIRGSLLILSLAGAATMWFGRVAEAGGQNCCCQTCRQPCGRCNCCSSQSCRAPVCQARDEVATEYRTEKFYETVPTTVTENVTVDEGSYQTIWVPRVTTRPVARTVYQTREAYRSVPYQVTRRVNDCDPQLGSIQASRPVPDYGTANRYSGNTATAGNYPTLAIPRVATAPSTDANAGRVPEARYAEAPVTPIRPRSASNSSRSGNSTSADSRVAERSSLFVPAPSAAQVWRSTTIR